MTCAPCIPEQSRRQPSPARILTLAVPAARSHKRHAARAIAALAVAAAVLSAGGVAAAVSGDPLTPYKSVVNVVRGGFNNVMPDRSMIAPEPLTKTPKPKAKLAAAKAERTAKARAPSGQHALVARRLADRQHRGASGIATPVTVRGGTATGGTDMGSTASSLTATRLMAVSPTATHVTGTGASGTAQMISRPSMRAPDGGDGGGRNSESDDSGGQEDVAGDSRR